MPGSLEQAGGARQFAGPLSFILILAALVALAPGEHWDAGFIAGVVVVNAIIGFINEIRAEGEVRSLGTLSQNPCTGRVEYRWASSSMGAGPGASGAGDDY